MGVEPPPEFLLGRAHDDPRRGGDAIVPEDPEIRIYDYRLEAHTNNRVWKGTYTPFDEGHPSRLPEQTARIVFRYKPKAAEMNPVIPEWARKAVEDQLEWRLELDESGSDVDPRLSLKWYPGKIGIDTGPCRGPFFPGRCCCARRRGSKPPHLCHGSPG